MNVQSREYRHVDTILKTGTLLYFYFIFPELYHVYWPRIRLMLVRRLAAFPCRSYILNLKYPLPQQSQVCDKIPTEKIVGLNAHAHGRFAPSSDGRFAPREYFFFIQHVQKL